MLYYTLEYSNGVSFVKTDDKQCVIVKRMDNRVVVEGNPFAFNHLPDNASISPINEAAFYDAYVKAVHEITNKTFIQ